MNNMFEKERLAELANDISMKLKDFGMSPDYATRFLITLAAGLCSGSPEMASVNKSMFIVYFSSMLDEFLKMDLEDGQAEV